MNKKILFITFLMLFCTTVFGEGGYWQEPKDYQLNMVLNANIKINGEVQNSDNLEIAAFCNGEIRGTTKTTIENGESNVFFTIGGNNNGEKISLKLYVPGTGNNEDKVLGTDYTLTFMDDAYIGFDPLLYIDFYEKHWDYTGNYENSMTVECTIIIDGVKQDRTDLELAAFCGNELRGVAKPQKYQTASNEYLYLTALTIGGNNGERIDFKVYDPIRGIEIPTEYFVNFVTDETVGNEEALSIEFITTPYVAQVGDKKYQSLEKALKALTDGSTLTILEDITISEKWDNRSTGAKVSVPVTINGNGKTIKFAGEINDGLNYTAAFRFEAAATIKNLKIDMSDATSNYSGRFSAVAAKLDITVDACTFIGNANYNNTKAIIFGEGAGPALADVNVSITNSHFENWKYGVSDNQNAQDAKNVKIVQNVFEDASVNVSALESVIFNENKLNEGNVTITSYTNKTALKVEAVKNTLDTDETNTIQVNPANVNAQDGFLLPVAEVGGKYYLELDKAFAAAQNGDEVKVLQSGIYALSTSGKDLTITGAVEGVEFANIGPHGMGGANVTFNNVTFTYANNSTYQGLQHSGNLVYNDCTFNGQVFLYGASETFNGCTFNQTTDNYNVWTYGAKEVAFNECTFNSAGKSVLIYAEAANLINNVTVEDCTFKASAAVTGKAAIEMDSELTAGINLTISNTTATGFGLGNVSVNSLWNNKKPITDQASFDKNNDITVKVDGTIVLEPIVGTITPGYTSTTSVWGEANSNAKESLEIKIYAGETLIGTTSLNNINNIIDGTKRNVTWHAQFDPNDNDEYWTTTWVKLTPEVQPTTVKLYIDGYFLAENNVQMNGPDNLNSVVWENLFVAKVENTYYTTVTKAINAAQSGQTVQLLARTINEVIAPWAGDSQHTSEKSITIVGAKDANGNLLTTLKGGLFLGYNDGTVRDYAITVKDINFVGKGVTVANQKNVVIEGNKFTEIEALVSDKHANSGSAILIIGTENEKSIVATVKNNVIENVTGTKQAGIYMSQVANVTVEGNTVTGTTHNAITISAATDATINVTNNTLSNWGKGGEGRAIRTSGGATVKVTENVMSNANAPEEFVKIIGATTIDASANYWNGNTPLAEGMFYTNLTSDPVDILKSYYTDSTKQNLVNLSASVAKIGNKYYQTLPAAIEAAEAGQTIELLADIEASEVIEINKSLTINGDDHKVTSSASRVFRLTTSNTEVALNDVDMVNTKASSYTADIRGISIDPDLTNVQMTLNSCSVDFTDASACDWSYAVNVSGNGTGHTVTVNGGTYEGANVINVYGANNTVVVKDATLISMYPNNDVYYGSCIWVLQNQGSSVEATGNTFIGSNAVAFNLGTGTALTESNNTDNTTMCVAKIGDTYYTSLADAFAAAQDGNTIKVLHDISLAETVKVNNQITLDLNGKTITGTDNATVSFALIEIQPGKELTVEGNGTITLKATNNRAWSAYSSVISNQRGKLVVENGTIEHLGGTDMAYAIDNLTNTGAQIAETLINGGTIKSPYRAIRQFLNSSAQGVNNILTINGGTIEGTNKAIWMQDPNTNANPGKLTIGVNANLKGNVYLDVTEGSTEWPVEISIVDAAFADGYTVITENIPEKYVVKNNNGIWGVFNAVAKVGETTYASLADAANAANGSEITIIRNFEEVYTVADGANVKINFGVYTMTGSILAPNANLTVANGTIINNDKGVSAIEINVGTLTLDGVKVSSARHAVRIDGAVTATINGGEYTLITSAGVTQHALNVSGTANVIINDGKFVGPKGTDSNSGRAINVQTGAKVTIYGGLYSGGKNETLKSVGELEVYGGKYDQDVKEYCAPARICKANDDIVYKYIVVPGLDGSGTETDPFLITNLTELEYFKASVNAGETTYNQEGVWVALGADIDMTSVANWAPIGSFDVSYDGNFNGQGHKIMNLKMSDNVAATGESYLGFFGVTANNVIKNFVIENVTIESEGQIVAAAIAYPYYTTVSDITVCGDIAIKGGNYTAGVLAYTRLCVNASNLTVSGNSGSYITGAQVVGGVIADIQMNHGLVANYSNFSASGLEITGTMNVGGISGIISGQTLNGATVKNVTLNCSDARVGVVSGSMGATSTISTVVAENVTGATAIIGATYDYAKAIEARIVDTYYATLEAALLAEGNNVTLLVPYTVEADETVVLDLNGKTVTMEDASAATSAMIKNYGNLTISNGKLSFKATAPSANNAYASNTISNYGEITIESGIIENLSTGSACYALDNYAGSTATINGGKLTAEKTTVRVFNWTNGEANATTLNVNDGEIYSKDGYGINVNSGNAPYVALNIAGGTITTDDTDYNLAVYVVNKNSAENFTVNVTAGTFNGNFALNGVTATTMAEGKVSISGGTFEGVICYETPAYGFIIGGAFVNDPSAFVAVDYSAVYDGEYFIVRLTSGTQTREFASAGWYWFSTYINLNANGENSLDIFKSAFVDDNNIVKVKQIKGQDGYVGYNSAYGIWTNGGLMAITNTDMYMINMKEAHTINLTGEFAEEGYEIPLNEGWNWIGYPVREEINVKDALANLTPKEGDAFKSQNKSAYFTGGAWRIEGGWDRMIPGQGYKYYRKPGNGNTSLIYSTEVKPSSESDDNRGINHWVANATKYPGNMTVIAMLNIDGEAASDNYEVAAFANGECRGSARPFYVEEMDAYVMIMTINGEEVEELTFKCYDVNYGTEYELSNRFNYSDDAILGSIEEPYMFFMNTLGIEESILDMINIYPNPTTTDRAINLQATCDNVEVFNALGVKVAEYQNVDTIDALETAGVYVIRVTINGEVKNCRLVVK